ncbi:MAG: hypothetical protein ABI540_05755, partial [Spartobacteria bacterium]
SVTGQLLPLEAVNRDADGQIISIEEAYQNSGSQEARGVDLGLQYVIETRFGVFTWLTQATYLDSFQFSQLPGETERELRSGFLPGVDPDEGYLKWKANSRIDWAWHGFDLVTTVHYLDGFHEILARDSSFPDGKKEHYIKQTWFFDVQASYNFTFAPPVETQPVAGYAKDSQDITSSGDGQPAQSASAQTANFALPIWKRVLNNTIVTIGCNDVFGQDPPHAGTTTNYADFLYDPTGRFVYVSLTKKF